MAHTAISLKEVLKERWDYDIMHQYMNAKDLEIQRALMDTRRGTQRRFYDTTSGKIVYNQFPITIEGSLLPQLTPEQKARQQEMVRKYAAIKRGNKPSYRQRQKNGRKAAER